MAQGASKAAFRAAALARRDALTATERAIASAFIARGVEAVLRQTRPQSIGIYRAYGSEADTMGIIAAAEAGGMAVALPAMVDADLVRFRSYRSGDPLVPDALAILAPADSTTVIDPELLIVPVTAFDRSGARLGKGRGVYDRAIAASRARGVQPRLVGIAFSVQESPAIPVEPHDIRLDWIVTETETLRFARGR
jgi:5-formyltetrahydrofolate cyclo-ligase